MDYQLLADLLFPSVTKTREELEKEYPARSLPEGAKVTRFAPSPTGFVHFGGLFPATVGERLAHQSGGVFYLRIEDTDAKREVPGAAEGLVKTLANYGVSFDEGMTLEGEKGAYGPYKQSLRRDIYHVYAKELVVKGLAYPCFSSEEDLEALKQVNKKEELKNTDWSEAEAQRKAEQMEARAITLEEVKAHLEKGDPFVLRLLSGGDKDKKIRFTDLIKGNLEFPENDEDFVLLKSDGIPTYHFAHAVDDHLMGTTHVIRGEEWLPSLAKHVQLFTFLGFKLPKYMHIAQIMRLDENGNKKKLSKRDMGANLDDYSRMGYCAESVCEYVMTLLNSNYEEWHAKNPELPYTDFPFSIKKMSVSGCLFDFDKLNDVSKNVLSRMTAEHVYDLTLAWAKENDPAFAELLARDAVYATSILSIGRGGKKPRKDFARLSEVKDYMGFFYDELFEIKDALPEQFSKEDVKACIADFAESYDESLDNTGWFDSVKAVAERQGFCPDVKAYKQSPESYKGHVGDVSSFIRLAITGKLNSPDLYTVMQILGKERSLARLDAFTQSL
ncbi:MAG: glutamate--tRNA ligase [Clostridia bacterium]|nr:glutamate--tRNA ligase [Clostridia bacterium]